MYQVNLMQLVQMIKNGQNPQQLLMHVLEQQPNNPMANNLLYLAKNNRTADIEQIARNISQQRGIDFDKEFNAFRNNLGL